jgi:hypothetical protein
MNVRDPAVRGDETHLPPDTGLHNKPLIDINIIEGTAPVRHESCALHKPLNIDQTNQLQMCVNMLTSQDGVLKPDGRILAELNYLSDNFIHTMYVQGE